MVFGWIIVLVVVLLIDWVIDFGVIMCSFWVGGDDVKVWLDDMLVLLLMLLGCC